MSYPKDNGDERKNSRFMHTKFEDCDTVEYDTEH